MKAACQSISCWTLRACNLSSFSFVPFFVYLFLLFARAGQRASTKEMPAARARPTTTHNCTMKAATTFITTTLLIALPFNTHSWSLPIRNMIISSPTTPLVSRYMNNQQYDACQEEEQLSLDPPSIDNSEDETRSTTRQILSLALPALISLSIDPLMTIADTACECMVCVFLSSHLILE